MARRNATIAPAGVPSSFEFHAKIGLCFRIFGINFDRLAELGERAGVITLPTQRHAQQQVCRRRAGIQLNGAAKFDGGTSQIAELPFDQSQFEMHLG